MKDNKHIQSFNEHQENLNISDVIHRSAMEKFNDKYSWEYNLRQVVRWEHEEADDDVNFFIKHWLEKIAEREGYKLVKNDV